jgi:hypothetical protein
MLLRHRFGETQPKRADLFTDYFVFDYFVIDSQWQTAIVLNTAQTAREQAHPE